MITIVGQLTNPGYGGILLGSISLLCSAMDKNYRWYSWTFYQGYGGMQRGLHSLHPQLPWADRGHTWGGASGAVKTNIFFPQMHNHKRWYSINYTTKTINDNIQIWYYSNTNNNNRCLTGWNLSSSNGFPGCWEWTGLEDRSLRSRSCSGCFYHVKYQSW